MTTHVNAQKPQASAPKPQASDQKTHGLNAGLNTHFPDASSSTGLALWRMTNAWQAAQRKALKPFEITHVQFVLLAHLVWLGDEEPVTQSRLAELAQTDRMMTSQVLRTLETKGLIERLPHPTDCRAKSLRATSAGHDLADQATAAVEGVDNNFFATLGDKKHEFTRMLNAVLRSAPLQPRPQPQT